MVFFLTNQNQRRKTIHITFESFTWCSKEESLTWTIKLLTASLHGLFLAKNSLYIIIYYCYYYYCFTFVFLILPATMRHHPESTTLIHDSFLSTLSLSFLFSEFRILRQIWQNKQTNTQTTKDFILRTKIHADYFSFWEWTSSKTKETYSKNKI